MMNKLKIIVLIALCSGVPAVSSAYAEIPYQLSLIYPLQTANELEDIKGVRINLVYGVNDNVKGLDLGMINRVTGTQEGLQVGFFNNNFKTKGLQIGLVNKVEYLEGLQIGFLNIHSEGARKYFPIVNFAF